MPANTLYRAGSLSRFAAALLFTASAAVAAPTEIGKIHPGEDDAPQILSSLYGGEFLPVDGTNDITGRDLTNGSVIARRLPDGPPDGPATADTDQLWDLRSFTARAVAKFSEFGQSFSVADSSGESVPLFTADGYGYDVSGEGQFAGDVSEARFVRAGETGTQSTVPADNLDGRDHVISYEIEGMPGGQPTWVMFWEDLSTARVTNPNRTTEDYNDLAVELRAAARVGGGAVAIPLPMPVWAGLALGGFAMFTVKRARGRV